mmetsp:Transcript_12580/g.23554  ORF Transcript_12580/g.23554 Transcript_12580/m.23554 type:complete len:492 (-) Transcript_12580:71-1546(-)
MARSSDGEQVAQHLCWKPSSGCVAALGVIGLVTAALAGCGGGDQQIETQCSAAQVQGKCSSCMCHAKGGKCSSPGFCTACRSPYTFVPSENGTSDSSCAFPCPHTAPPRPKMPKHATDLNGEEWPQACFNGTEPQHFFVIGDWGGAGVPPKPFWTGGRPFVKGIDDQAQQLVAARMKEVSETSKPLFLINVGDNFYPGGIDGHCQMDSGPAAFKSVQFAGIFEAVYVGDDLEKKEWWGVLGNHDYGGFCYLKAWDQNVFYTWNSNESRWLTPALYWHRRAQFRDFSADFFFLDTNIDDVFEPHADPGHNICSYQNSVTLPCTPGGPVCNGTTMKDPDSCQAWFKVNWQEQIKWLEAKLDASDADWQIVVAHYPADAAPAMTDALLPFSKKYGIDLIISGHRHQQEAHYKEARYGDTAWIVSGGGGGIESEGVPDVNGQDDQYGFFDVTISRDEILLEGYSHGGVHGKKTIRHRTTVHPRARATPQVEDTIV